MTRPPTTATRRIQRGLIPVLPVRTIVLWATLLLTASAQVRRQTGILSYQCPPQNGATISFSVTTSTLVTLKPTVANGVLCILSLRQDDGSLKPVARSYDGHDWERSGGVFAASLDEWDCNLFGCQATLPRGGPYVLQTRLATSARDPAFSDDTATTIGTLFTNKGNRLPEPSSVEAPVNKAEVARFLQSASFGPTMNDLNTWGEKSYAQYLQDQFAIAPTYHRVHFRRRANPRWNVHHPEFAAHLNPCAAGSTWRRHVITVKDTDKMLTVQRVGDRWQIKIDGRVRALLKQLRFHQENAAVTDGGSYKYCSSNEETQRDIFKVTLDGKCRPLRPDDLLVDFPPSYTPSARLLGLLPSLDTSNVWGIMPYSSTDFLTKAAFNASWCIGLPVPTIPPVPVFAQTVDGIWLQHDPRIQMKESSVEAPWKDGGAQSWLTNQTTYCSNVPRSFLNEATCVMSTQLACHPNSNDKRTISTGLMVCGSPGEVANDPNLGDSWMDVSSITISRQTQTQIKLPLATTSREVFSRQRETIWSDVAVKAPDQLRQRMAMALLHIFALPKTAIVAEEHHTEYFLQYYDIFVRNALGNYRNVLREVTYSPLMAESLTYLYSKAAAVQYTRTKTMIYPDENYSRELMQLFTIGLVELNMDGSPVLDANNKTIHTYDTKDIMSFARAWTGFERNAKRANIEGTENLNRIDPLKIEPAFRDKFPKSDLSDGYIGDHYPLCEDLPKKSFLRVGAKYRLLGTTPVTELFEDDWEPTATTRRLRLRRTTTGLFEKLCASARGSCSFPSVVVLEQNIACIQSADECKVDTVRVVQVDNVYYEYVHQPCVQLSFYPNAKKVTGLTQATRSMCANPVLPLASEACCDSTGSAQTWCSYGGERMTLDSAHQRCKSIGKTLCDFKSITTSQECPHTGYRWTSSSCNLKVKIMLNGEVAIVHDLSKTPSSVARATQNYFVVYWKNKKYPSLANNCGSGNCQRVDDTCICDIRVNNAPVFASPPRQAYEILEKLRIGHPGPKIHDSTAFVSRKVKDYTIHSANQTCCSQDTVFEVTDRNGQTRFFKNIASTISLAGTNFQFRNPPQFNSLVGSELSVVDAQYETEAVIDHLFYHKNTPPFVALRFIQRFGISNPSPRYVLVVATAFRDGVFTDGESTFGTGEYGDLQALISATLLDREARSFILEQDPSFGSLREPILKVMGLLRATQYESDSPLIELDLMDEKIGQMAFEQTSVFSFFRPQYSPVEIIGLGLAAPEAEVMSSGRVIGLLNGLFSVVKHGLVKCDVGFGAYGDCSKSSSAMIQTFQYARPKSNEDTLSDLSDLLTGGRLGKAKSSTIISAMNTQTDPRKGIQLAMQLILASPEFHSTSRADPMATTNRTKISTTRTARQPGYKVVIHLALVGGCDSFNVLVPGENCSSLFEEYTNMRGSVALSSSDVLPLNGNLGTPQSCDEFTVHNGLPFLQELYNDQDLLFLANVGVLTEPCVRTNCNLKTETQLFAHNTMQEEVNSLDPFNIAAGTSQLGRMVDVLQANGFSTGRTAVESTPASLACKSASAPPIVTLDQNGVQPFNVNPSTPAMNKVIRELNAKEGSRNGVFGDVWSSLLQRSLDQTEDLVDLLNGTPTQTDFPESDLGNRLKLVSQLIAQRQKRGVNRDFFFVPFEGFDTHSDVKTTLKEKFLELNKALEDFVAELKLLGVWDDVVIVQTSEFGRTLTENTSGGTDHGWGGHYWAAGGSIRGQRILGSYPSTLYPEGASSLDRGRFIPSTSWDSVFNGVAEWIGIRDESDLDLVLPNRKNFNSLYKAADLFNSRVNATMT